MVSTDEDYNLSKKLLLQIPHTRTFSSNYIIFPNNIDIGSFNYVHLFHKYQILSKLNIINYGNFEDSESGYSFSAKDYIFKNRFSSNINSKLYSSFDIKYIHSYIDNYSSDAVAFKFSLYYYNTRFLLQSFIDNYGITFSPYTNFYEHFPSSYGCKIMVLPKYINSVLSLKYNSFRDYQILNISGELFLFSNSSIYVGFSSLSQKLYYGDFYTDFLTGFSIGFSTTYKKYFMNIAFKNLGSIGLISSLTITKSIN